MIEVSETISISENDVQIDFVQASGPGGQNVNKLATQAQLRFNTISLPAEVRERLKKLAGKRMLEDGTLLIQARRYRTQEQNRQDALERLKRLIYQASLPPRERRKTRPTAASRRRRLAVKRRHAEQKRLRQTSPTLDD